VWRYSFVPDILSFSTYASLRIPFVFDQRACGIPLFLTYVPPMSLPFRQRSASEPACLPVNEPAFRQRFVCKEPVYLSACLPACLPACQRACVSTTFRLRAIYETANVLPASLPKSLQRDCGSVNEPACLPTCTRAYHLRDLPCF
jgi:hypothetical protein